MRNIKQIAISLWFIILLLNFTTLEAQTSDIDVTGRVLDELNEPLAGVSVVIKDTKIGTVTNHDGVFSIKVANPQSVLVFSYIGFKKLFKF
jgi:hypothetical protein